MTRPIKHLSDIQGIGQAHETRLNKLGIFKPLDVLFHLPKNYQDRTKPTPLKALRPGTEQLIQAEIASTSISYGKKRMLLCHLIEGEHTLLLRFFHFNKRQMAYLQQGLCIRCFGQIRQGFSSLEIVHPEYQLINKFHPPAFDTALTPIYPTTEGMSQAKLRMLVKTILEQADLHKLHDYFPPSLAKKFSLAPLIKSLQLLHFPPPKLSLHEVKEGRHPYQQRLILDELIAHRLSMRQKRDERQKIHAIPLPFNENKIKQFLKTLPFRLTASQQKVHQQIRADLEKDQAMLRLLQGDVGSGKTIIAILAILQTIAHNYQAVIMAPTEVLAEQHYHHFNDLLSPLNIKITYLSGSLKQNERRASEQAIIEGTSKVIVGTQALFQERITFDRLALVIIDEQHRFGVTQRQAMKDKGSLNNQEPHQLIMSATPIPRTLAMTFYADLDVSTIEGLPPGRQIIQTAVVPHSRRDKVIKRVKLAAESGQQIYWVCTLIEESETLNSENAEDTAKNLKNALPELNIGLIHGRLKNDEKSAIMADFNAGKIHVLVATTVIEVGVNVPNASVMIIENPERLGLAQLHQLRGRIGRGVNKSYCILLYHDPISGIAKERLGIIRDHHDGFKIAAFDLELRGPGEVLGTRQTGDMHFKIANLSRDQYLIDKAQQIADTLFESYPEAIIPLIKRWIGQDEHYSRV